VLAFECRLNRFETIDEKQWQEKIHNILQLLYPKYICCAREIKFYGGKKDKQPDFLLVDANGFVDMPKQMKHSYYFSIRRIFHI